jgi:hypothetical protein
MKHIYNCWKPKFRSYDHFLASPALACETTRNGMCYKLAVPKYDINNFCRSKIGAVKCRFYCFYSELFVLLLYFRVMYTFHC